MATHSSVLAGRIAWTEEPREVTNSQTQLSDSHFNAQPVLSEHLSYVTMEVQYLYSVSLP